MAESYAHRFVTQLTVPRHHNDISTQRGRSRRSSTGKSAGSKRASKFHHSVYVVELARDVWKASAKFRRANPDRDPAKPCLYVGMSGLTPEERLANHRAGIRSSRLVHQFSLELRPDLYEGLNPMSFREAARMEKVLAKVLRGDGYGVWQN